MKRYFLKSILFLMILFLRVPFSGFADSDYKFTDAQGKEVTLPLDRPVFSEKNPGPWKGLERLHVPEVSRKNRKEGLETVQYVSFHLMHSPGLPGKENKITAVYVLDKDNLMIAYQAFNPQDQELTFTARINGNLNYIQVYVDCAEHNGLWRKEFRLA